jgi:CHASE2 domain-containing sensor protein
MAVGVLVFAKSRIEGTPFGDWFNAQGHNLLGALISKYDPNEDLPVKIVDISSLPRDKDGATPSGKLREIVTALVDSKARAIAIDINFSPRTDIEKDAVDTFSRAEGDDEFFEFLHKQPIPVYVGVYNPGVEPSSWLGLKENADLASDITFYSLDTYKIPARFKCEGQERSLNSLSTALADNLDHPHPPDWLKEYLTDPNSAHELKKMQLNNKKGEKVNCSSSSTLVNYAKLDLMEKLSIPAPDRNSILIAKNPDGLSKFQNKLVIIGYGQQDKATDSFVVNGYRRPIFGTYVHAMGTYTLVASPLYELKSKASETLDILLGFLLVLIFSSIRWLNIDSPSSMHRWEWICVFVSIITVFTAGFALIYFYRTLWSDFLLVVLVLLLHSSVQNFIYVGLNKCYIAIGQLFTKKTGAEVNQL